MNLEEGIFDNFSFILEADNLDKPFVSGDEFVVRLGQVKPTVELCSCGIMGDLGATAWIEFSGDSGVLWVLSKKTNWWVN